MEKIISVNGYNFLVDFDYQPYEPVERHYPGASESVEINDVWSSGGLKLEEWALELIQDDLEIACLEAVAIDQEEAKLAKEEARMEAWEARQENKLFIL